MKVPDHFTAIAGETLGLEREAAANRCMWAVIYGLVPFQDGNQWCVLLGPDIQSGICGFGDTPLEAIHDFERAMRRPIPAAPSTALEDKQ